MPNHHRLSSASRGAKPEARPQSSVGNFKLSGLGCRLIEG